MVEVDLNIELIEKLLSDGRKWLQNLNEPTVADIHGKFIALSMAGCKLTIMA